MVSNYPSGTARLREKQTDKIVLLTLTFGG